MHCCNINKSRKGDFFWFTWYALLLTIIFSRELGVVVFHEFKMAPSGLRIELLSLL